MTDHRLIALRSTLNVSSIYAVAVGTKMRHPEGGGHVDGITWSSAARGLTAHGRGLPEVCWTWAEIEHAVRLVLTPGLCTALAAWSARWRSMHDARPYLDRINGHQTYAWCTYRYVTDLAQAIELDVQHQVAQILTRRADQAGAPQQLAML